MKGTEGPNDTGNSCCEAAPGSGWGAAPGGWRKAAPLGGCVAVPESGRVGGRGRGGKTTGILPILLIPSTPRWRGVDLDNLVDLCDLGVPGEDLGEEFMEAASASSSSRIRSKSTKGGAFTKNIWTAGLHCLPWQATLSQFLTSFIAPEICSTKTGLRSEILNCFL